MTTPDSVQRYAMSLLEAHPEMTVSTEPLAPISTAQASAWPHGSRWVVEARRDQMLMCIVVLDADAQVVRKTDPLRLTAAIDA